MFKMNGSFGKRLPFRTICRGMNRPTCKRWGVVAQVREPYALVAAFAAFHLDQGAERIILYFDDPEDPAADALAGQDGIDVIRCDEAHWRNTPRGSRPESSSRRQIVNFRQAYARSDLDWLAHLDADEFLDMPRGIGPSLKAFGPGAAWIRLPVAERFWAGSFDGEALFSRCFRQPLASSDAVMQVYGEDETHLMPRGMAGHNLGKFLASPKRDGRPTIHSVKYRGSPEDLPSSEARKAVLFHFEGLTARHWALKHLRQALQILNGLKPMRASRRQVTFDILRAEDPLAAALGWVEHVYVLQPEVVTQLKKRKCILKRDLGILRKTETRFPGTAERLTPAAIDASIADTLEATVEDVLRRRRDAAKIRRHALVG